MRHRWSPKITSMVVVLLYQCSSYYLPVTIYWKWSYTLVVSDSLPVERNIFTWLHIGNNYKNVLQPFKRETHVVDAAARENERFTSAKWWKQFAPNSNSFRSELALGSTSLSASMLAMLRSTAKWILVPFRHPLYVGISVVVEVFRIPV
jgi:hypothetical protein